MKDSRSRTPILVGFFAVAIIVLAAAAYLYDHSRRDTIANGVRVAGVDIGGLSSSAARERLQTQLVTHLDGAVTVRWHGHAWQLTGRQARVAVDTNALVDQALQASREGSIFTRTFRELTGGSVGRDIAPQVNYDHTAVHDLLSRVRANVDLPARDAVVSPGSSGLSTVSSRTGLWVNSDRLAVLVERALSNPQAARTIGVTTKIVQPKITTGQLASKYPAYIVIDRGAFTLHYYHDLKLTRTYPIAVGMQGLATPGGMYSIQWKQVDPPWYVPNSAWAGSLAGQVIPPGPSDPLKARFMSFDGGAGIHGIDPSEYGTIGHNASHGCVRMTIPDVIDLYARTPVGTPVYII